MSYGVESISALLKDFTPYITTLGLEQSVECIHKIQYQELVLFVITAKTTEDKIKISTTLEATNKAINGDRLRRHTHITLKGIQRIPAIKVWIYEAPYEIENMHIWQKRCTYGEQRDQAITRHNIPGLDIYNGVRSLSFKNISMPIPATLFVRGNRIRVKYLGQDRTPTCSICNTRGHYRMECPRAQETPKQRENLVSGQEPEPIQELNWNLNQKLNQLYLTQQPIQHQPGINTSWLT